VNRVIPPLEAITWFCVPLFPSFITLTAVSVPGVSLIPSGLAFSLLGIMAAFALLGIVALLMPPRQAPPTLLPLIGWLCAALLSAALGFNPRAGLLFIAIYGLGVVWHLAIVRFYREPWMSAATFWPFLASGLLASAAAIAMVVWRWPAGQYAIGHGRSIGTFILPGELAGYLIVYLPIAFGVALATRFAALRALAWCGCALGGVAFLMTFSRAGWMGLAAAVAFYIFATRERGQTRYAILAVLVGIAAVLLVFNAHHNPSENYTRLSIWQAAIDIVERFPLTGVGPFDFASAYALVRLPDGDATAFHAHSFLLTIFAEMGIVGVLAVLWLGWSFACALRDRLAAASPLHKQLALAVVAGLVGTLVQGLIDTVSVVIFGLWLPTMALALAMARDGLGEDPG
jgi:putative inorganic carbon (HCO3(-)) transporter